MSTDWSAVAQVLIGIEQEHSIVDAIRDLIPLDYWEDVSKMEDMINILEGEFRDVWRFAETFISRNNIRDKMMQLQDVEFTIARTLATNAEHYRVMHILWSQKARIISYANYRINQTIEEERKQRRDDRNNNEAPEKRQRK